MDAVVRMGSSIHIFTKEKYGIIYMLNQNERLNDTYTLLEELESRAEADILKNMKHTYLPRVYDFLEIDGEIYTVIDYIPGKSMDKVLQEKDALLRKRF